MPVYEYTAINSKGKNIKGSLDADSVRAARQKLRTQNIYPTEITEANQASQNKNKDIRKWFQGDRLGLKELSVVTRQLSTLIGAGLPVVESLAALSDQTDSPTLKRIVTDVREKVEEGSSLAKAFQGFPKAFPRMYVNMIGSGEASGTLHTVLENLAVYLEAQLELKRKIVSALFYPILMLVFCTLVVMALLTFVVPTVTEIFVKQGAILPLPTRIMLGISDFIRGYWWVLLVLLFGGISGLKAYHASKAGRLRIDALLLKIPLYSGLMLKITSARVSGTLGTLLASGVQVLEALDIVKNIVNNVHLASAIEGCRDGVREGKSLAKELSRSGYFPALLVHMVAVGESSGRLEQMLVKAGKSYENEVNATLSGLTSLIEPVMMIVLGGIVFSIVISILMPMVELINVIQR